jgi:hypothetical protein
MCQQMLRAKHQLTMSVFNNPNDEQSWNTDCTAVSGTMQNVLLTVSERARCNVLFYDAVNMRRVSEWEVATKAAHAAQPAL